MFKISIFFGDQPKQLLMRHGNLEQMTTCSGKQYSVWLNSSCLPFDLTFSDRSKEGEKQELLNIMLGQWNQECSLRCQYPQIFIFGLFTWNLIIFQILLSEEVCQQVKFYQSTHNVTLHCSKELTLIPKLYSHVQLLGKQNYYQLLQ